VFHDPAWSGNRRLRSPINRAAWLSEAWIRFVITILYLSIVWMLDVASVDHRSALPSIYICIGRACITLHKLVAVSSYVTKLIGV
jgi:hypothetical protein